MTLLRPKHLLMLEEMERRGTPEAEGVRLCFELLAVADAIDRDCARRLEPHGLSEARFVMLVMLERSSKGLAPSALADRAGVTRGTITGLLDGLERDGLVRRAPDPADRRALLIRLTKRGEALARELLSEHARWIGGLFAAVSETERRLLSGLLGRAWSATNEGRVGEAARRSADGRYG